MKFTGERYIPSEQGEIRLEHFHRYTSILGMIAKKDVLDLSCGEGYGSYLMSDHAAYVTGVDISKETINHAVKKYKKSNLTFVECDALELVFPSNSFDVVVSFETIEHLTDQHKMVKEIKRVLRPGGKLLISSPNKSVYSADDAENEFHQKELNFQEIEKLLKDSFRFVNFYGQRLMIGSVIQPLHSAPKTAEIFSDDGDRIFNEAPMIANPKYFIAVCSDRKSSLKSIAMSTLYPTNLDLLNHYVGFAKWAKIMNSTVAERDAQIIDYNQKIEEVSVWAQSLKQQLADQEKRISELVALQHERDEKIVYLNKKLKGIS